MTWKTLVWKELRERPWAVCTCGIAILVGVAAFVAIRNVAVFSERAVAGQLDALGANVLLLPKGVTLQDYYAADLHGQTLPEKYANKLAFANLHGVEHLSPKLCVPVSIGGHSTTLTGIMPQKQFTQKAAFGGMTLLSQEHVGCKGTVKIPGSLDSSDPKSLAERRVIEDLEPDQLIAGIEIAELAGLHAGDTVQVQGHAFRVLSILPRTGRCDDGRVFAHLHTVQDISQLGPVVNVIEIMGCCEMIATSLIPELTRMFPDAKVATISQVVATQLSVNRLMTRLSWSFLGILVGLGGVSIAGTMFANVHERRREIGTLMALGATPRTISRLFLAKALVLGLVGGSGGYLVGTLLAVWLGPQCVGVEVHPIPSLALLATSLAATVAMLATYFPARRAAQVDPCLCFQEI